ncbi:fatty acid desaturase [Fulvivirgaceae bacterium BMA12]|uniref:Fatty acid desaturase n=1 Tax=Agaribacillus aureus TaxID=3051825 RepID=A0ABT8KZU7_9BACT|nr:fatty acid desaturase [Fulvivirgaceae bacterium BMA12]
MIIDKEPTLTKRVKLLEGKELILYSKKYAVENRRKSWIYTISTLIFLILAFAGTYNEIHWVLRLAFSLVTALFIVKFFVIYHDYQHRAILQNSILAKCIMKAFGLFVLAPSAIWRRTHNHHHNYNSKLSHEGIGSYPLISKDAYQKLSAKERLRYLAMRHPVTIFSGYITLFLFDFNIKPLFRSPKNHWDSFFALFFHFLIGGLIYNYGGIEALFFSWLLPFVLAHGFGAYLFYAQHNFPGATFADNSNWDYTKAAIHSTSFLVMNPVMAWFTGNIGYHHVHHVNHRIPFYRLKEVMQEMPELQNPITTTLRPTDIMACLKLKVWDFEKGEMTGL